MVCLLFSFLILSSSRRFPEVWKSWKSPLTFFRLSWREVLMLFMLEVRLASESLKLSLLSLHWTSSSFLSSVIFFLVSVVKASISFSSTLNCLLHEKTK